MFSFIFEQSLRRSYRYFKKEKFARFFTAAIFLLVFFGVVTGVYLFFLYGFRFILSDAYFGSALILYSYELFFLVVGMLIFASAIIGGIFLLFRRGDSQWIMASPSYRFQPYFVFGRVFGTALWPFLAIMLPALMAIARIFNFSFFIFLMALFEMVLYTAFCVFSALVLLMVSAWILEYSASVGSCRLTLRNMALFIGGFLALPVYFVWSNLKFLDFENIFQAKALNQQVPDIAPILAQFKIFPSHFLADAVYFLESRGFSGYFKDAFWLILLIAIACTAYYFLQKKYLVLWQILQEGDFSAGLSASGKPQRHTFSGLASAESIGMALFWKETVSFFRNMKGIMWLGFLMFLWLIQAGTNFIFAHKLTEEVTAVSRAVGMLQFAVIIYFISTFVLRFAFPSFSTEKKTAWILKSAPIDLGKIFIAKQIFFSVLFSAIAVLFVILNAAAVQISLPLGVVFFLTVVLSVTAVTSIGLGLGAIYPNFETDDPELLSTTLPGLAFIFSALLYGLLGALSYGSLLFFSRADLLYLFAAFSLALIFFISHRALIALRRLEF